MDSRAWQEGFRALKQPPDERESIMTQAFVFPGQGSQTVGMGRALAEAYPEARAVFATVDDALGQCGTSR